MNGSPDYFPRNASLKLRNWKAGKSEKQQNLTKISLHLLSFQGTQSFSGDGLPETHRPDALHHDLELRGHRQGHRNGPLRPVPHGTAAAATDLLKEAPPGEGRLVLQATQQGRQLLVSQHCQGRRELTKFPKVRLCLVTLYFYDFFGTFPSLILEEDLCIEVATELHGSQCLICGSLLKAHRTIQHTESCQRHNFRSPSTIQGRNDTSGTKKHNSLRSKIAVQWRYWPVPKEVRVATSWNPTHEWIHVLLPSWCSWACLQTHVYIIGTIGEEVLLPKRLK